jgi:hypothetical protein
MAASAVVIDPAVATMAVHDVRPADHTVDDTAGDRADRSGYDGAGARTDGNAFQRSGLGGDGCNRQHQQNILDLSIERMTISLVKLLKRISSGLEQTD